MKALVFHKKGNVSVENVPEPEIKNSTDILLKVTSTAICGSDLHLYNGFNPTMKDGDILGHEFMGEIIETGKSVEKLKKGDRIAVPFNIACGHCHFCTNSMTALCDNSNPNNEMLEKAYGGTGAALFGYSHMYGGFDGGQAEYVRVPYADTGHIKIPEELSDEKVLFLTDIFPTGYMAAENASIKPGDIVAVFGCGPVGQFAIRSAFILGAEKVIAIDDVPERLAMAASAGAETIDFQKEKDIVEALKEKTSGNGPDSVIDAVGMEAHGTGAAAIYDQVTNAIMLQTDRPTALRQAIQACRKGGTVSIPGVYSGFIDKLNFGSAFAKGLTFKMGQTHTHRYLELLLKKIVDGEIDPSFVITHTMPLVEASNAYEIFKNKDDNCIKVVLKP